MDIDLKLQGYGPSSWARGGLVEGVWRPEEGESSFSGIGSRQGHLPGVCFTSNRWIKGLALPLFVICTEVLIVEKAVNKCL